MQAALDEIAAVSDQKRKIELYKQKLGEMFKKKDKEGLKHFVQLSYALYEKSPC